MVQKESISSLRVFHSMQWLRFVTVSGAGDSLHSLRMASYSPHCLLMPSQLSILNRAVCKAGSVKNYGIKIK